MAKRQQAAQKNVATASPKTLALEKNNSNELKISDLLLLVGLPLLVYLQVATFEFSYHDDDVIILDGAKTLAAPFNFHDIFQTDAWLKVKQIELYRPLQSLSFWLDAHLFGTSPGGFHLHNLLLHLLNCLLVGRFLILFSGSRAVAVVGGLVWGLNFLNTHAVCWVPARGDLLLASWGLIFLISWLKLLETKQLTWAGLNIMAFAAALFAKENAVLLPVFAVILYFFKNEKPALGILAVPAVGWLAFAAGYFSLRGQSIATQGQTLSIESFLKNVRVLPEEVFKWFVPARFSVMAGFEIGLLVGGLAVFAGLFLLLKKFLTRNPSRKSQVGFALALVVLPLLPSMFYSPQFVSYGYDYLDHRLCFPSIGLALLVGLLVSDWRFFQEKSAVVLTALAFYFGVFAFFHAKNYKNYDSYYQNAMTTNPRSGLALTNYGILKRKAGDRDEAEKLFEKALVVAPNYDFLQAEYATLENEKGNFQKALDFTNQLLDGSANRLQSSRDVILCHRGFAKAKLGQNDAAIADFQAAIALNSKNPQYFQNLGAVYEELNRSPEAIEAYSKAIELNPAQVQSLYRRAFQFGKTGQAKLAIADLDRAISLDANRGEFYYFRAMAYKDLNDRERYCDNMKRAAAMNLREAVEPAKMFCQ